VVVAVVMVAAFSVVYMMSTQQRCEERACLPAAIVASPKPEAAVDDHAQKRLLPFFPEQPCRFADPKNEFDEPMPADISHAFSMAVNYPTFPRAFIMGYETFFRYHPNATLYIYTTLKEIDPRFAQHGFKVVLVPWNLTDLIRQLVEVVPEMDTMVFDTREWKTNITTMMSQHFMMVADFTRLILLYLHGGSWIDADAIYMRPFTFRNAIPCFDQHWPPEPSFVQCTDDKRPVIPYDTSHPFVTDKAFYCTNGILGGFGKGHPFFRKALIRIAMAWRTAEPFQHHRILSIGAHLFVDLLANTTNSKIPHPHRLAPHEWPNLYDLDRLYGYLMDPGVLEARFKKNWTRMMEDFEERKVFSLQIYHFWYVSADGMKMLFEENGTHGFFYLAWKKHCLFSCDDPFE